MNRDNHHHPARATLLCILMMVIALPVDADTVTLKNGRKIEGIIDPNSTTESRVVIRTPAGVVNVPRANVSEIIQDKDIGYGEASGDLAALAGDLDRARTMYESALETAPDNKGLVEKLNKLQEKIEQRDQQKYGSDLDRIRQALADGEYQQAIEQARALAERAPEDSMDRRCRGLVVEGYLGLARLHRKASQWETARTAYLSAFEANADDPLPPLELAEMLSNLPGERLAATTYFNQAMELAEKNPGRIDSDRLLNARFMLGKDYFELDNYRLATVTLLNVMRMDTGFKHPEAIDLAVEAYGKIGAGSSPADQREIVNNLQAFILIYQKNERATLLLGRVYFDMADWTNAVSTLKRVTDSADVDPSNPVIQEALYYQGVAQRHLGRNQAAAASLQRIVDNNGGNYDVYVELGELRLKETRYKDAYDLFDKALILDATKVRPWLNKGLVLTETGLNDEALTSLKKAAELDPHDPEIRYQIARNYLAKGNFDEAIRLGRAIVRVVQRRIENKSTAEQARLLSDCFMLLGDANGRLGDHEVARQRYQRAIDYTPASGRGYEAMALSYQSDGLHKEAQEAFEKALSLEPKNPEYALNLGIHWHKYIRNPRKALPYYEKYLELGGRNPRVWTWIEECGGTPSPNK